MDLFENRCFNIDYLKYFLLLLENSFEILSIFYYVYLRPKMVLHLETLLLLIYFFYLLLFLSLCCCHSLSNIIVCYSPFLFFFSFPVSDSGVGVGCAGQTLVWVYRSSLYLVCSYCFELCLACRSMDPLDLMHVFVFEFVFYTLCTLCMVASPCLGSRFYPCLLGPLISC